MIRNFVGGILIGIANIIPGVSGGTFIVLLGLFDKMMQSISDIFSLKVDMKKRIESIFFIVQILIGCAIGVVVFAKVLEFLFENFPMQTQTWFMGLILLSLPLLKKDEMKDEKINYIWLIIGILIIALITFLSPGASEVTYPLQELLDMNLDLKYILILIMIGLIGGATMIFPGVSGSMILLILGYYHLFKSYLANVTSFELGILIPLCIIAIGVAIGIIVGAKVINWLLKKYHRNIMSLIFGLIIMSSIAMLVMIPDYYPNGFKLIDIITSVITFIIGGVMVQFLEKLKSAK